MHRQPVVGPLRIRGVSNAIAFVAGVLPLIIGEAFQPEGHSRSMEYGRAFSWRAVLRTAVFGRLGSEVISDRNAD